VTTVVLVRVPRDLGWAQLVRAICRHARVPVSSETYWTHGYGDIHIDLGDTPAAEARYCVELYALPIGVEYRILEEGHNSVPKPQSERLVTR
jgi:hypothetical protein